MPGRGFNIPKDMLPHRDRLSDDEKKRFARAWTRITLRSRKAWLAFLAGWGGAFLFFGHFMPPWDSGLTGFDFYFMYGWELFASLILASSLAYSVTKKDIAREVTEHLGIRNEKGA